MATGRETGLLDVAATISSLPEGVPEEDDTDLEAELTTEETIEETRETEPEDVARATLLVVESTVAWAEVAEAPAAD